MLNHFKKVCLLVALSAALVSCGSETLKSDTSQGSSASQSSAASASAPQGPEARQIGTGSVVGTGGSVFPYNMYQNAILGSALQPQQTSSTSGGWLSMLRPLQGGRRSSLTSRLRNLMNAIFRRETSTPYLGSGSSVSYAFKQPPFGYANGFGNMGSLQNLNNQNLLAAASGYQPMVLPSSAFGNSGLTGLNVGNLGSNQGSGSSPQLTGSNGGTGSNYGWTSNQGSGSQAYPSQSYGNGQSYGTGSGSGTGTYQASVSNGGSYQAAASNYNPSTYSASYPSNSYQRSSSSSFKPITNSFSAGSVPAASASLSAPYSSGSKSSSSSSTSFQAQQ